MIFGGNDGDKRHIDLKDNIDRLILTGVVHNDEDTSEHAQQLFNTIKCNGVCFNIEVKEGKHTSPSGIDVVVDKNGEECTVVIIQHVKMFGKLNLLIGVLAIEIRSNKKSFAVAQPQLKNDQSKVELLLILS